VVTEISAFRLDYMPEAGSGTFAKLLTRYVRDGSIHPNDSVLVQFAGTYDELVCSEVGLRNCTFVNIAPGSQSTGATSASKFDAHRMPESDGTYDHVIGHAGLHHCSRPHEALHEMYRLGRKMVVFVENQDSAMMRAGAKAGVVGGYELGAVVDGEYSSGGVDGTGVPNHVYRWTRREVRKAVASFDPAYEVPVEFHAEWNLAGDRVGSELLAKKLHLRSSQSTILLNAGHRVLNGLAARQGNILAAAIRKDRAKLRPWMESPAALRRA
jgi:hypothetical protein